MNTYRKEASHVAKETSWTFWRFLPIAIIVIVVIAGIGFGLRSVGLIGGTIVERVVMKNSFQYKEGMEQRAAIMQANIVEIDVMLQSNPSNSTELMNQRAVLNAQLRAITINQ